MQKTVAGLEGHTAGKRTQKLNTSYLHVNNQPLGTTKKAGMKREHSPSDPYKRKARGKETIPGSYKNPLSPRGRASVSRYRLAGGAAEELIKILGASRSGKSQVSGASLGKRRRPDISAHRSF